MIQRLDLCHVIISRRLGNTNNMAAFLSDVSLISSCVVVFTDGEGWTEAAAASFRRGVVSSLEFDLAVRGGVRGRGGVDGGDGGVV